ncbi:hypothetical protein [Haloferax sp. DFSO52]|uniref:hypothetical protein n=1 Tax=Haloferax sp. DFSO52 TaxID=3388505 RepID=UPI003A89D9F7
MNRRALGIAGLILLVVVAGSVVVADRHAQRVALSHEESYLQSHLEEATCLTSSGTSETTGRNRASVVGRSVDGWTVRVSHQYWYSTEQISADAFSEAVYVVGVDAVRRVRGESLNLPC